MYAVYITCRLLAYHGLGGRFTCTNSNTFTNVNVPETDIFQYG